MALSVLEESVTWPWCIFHPCPDTLQCFDTVSWVTVP